MKTHRYCSSSRLVSFFLVLICCHGAIAQHSAQLSVPQSDKGTNPEYVIEFLHLTIPIAPGENGEGESFQKLLAAVDPQNIEIQANGDSLESRFPIVHVNVHDPALPADLRNANQNVDLPQMTGTPAIVARMTEPQCTNLIEDIKSDENAILGQAPTVTTPADEPVTIADGSYRPLTTSVKPITDKNGRIVAFQPQVQSIFEGNMTRMRVLSEGGNTRIELKADFTNVDRIRSLEVNAMESPSGVKIKLQIPYVSSKQIRVTSEIKPGESLFIIPAWHQVFVYSDQAKIKTNFGITYVSNLFGYDKPRRTDARIAFLLKVVRVNE